MGATNTFNNPNFNGIFESHGKLETEISHKAKISIDEIGSTAVASTLLSASMQAYINTKFECNHPFMFVIYDDKINEILFTGIFRGPN